MPLLNQPLTGVSVERFSASSALPPPYSVTRSSEAPPLENEDSLSNPSIAQDNETASLQFTETSTERHRQSTHTAGIPPRYSMIPDLPSTSHFQNGSIPHFEHSFIIPNGKPWATLRTFTPKSITGILGPLRSKPDIPLFYGDGPVVGMLELELETPQTVQEITISIQGYVLSGFVDHSVKFLDYNYFLWHKYMGNPRSTTQGTPKKFDGKLLGTYQFPFSFPFPTQVDVSLLDSGGSVSPFPQAKKSPSSSASLKNNKLSPAPREDQNISKAQKGGAPSIPPSFDENIVPAGVRYDMVVQIVHGRLRPDSKIRTPILYLPSSAPDAASLKRQEAYINNAMPPGPMSDPDGWASLQKCVVKGEFPGTKQASINCELYLAKPLSYTRGATIPCFLSLGSEDSKGLTFLCSPKSPRVRLVRYVSYNNPHNKDALKTVRTEVAFGVWWVPSKEIIQEPNIRHLQGEIHLPSDMKPSCVLQAFKIEYSVEYLPFVSNAFEYFPLKDSKGDPKESVLLSCPVEIATLHNPEFPCPLAFTEPTNLIQVSNAPHKLSEAWLKF